MNSQSDLRNEQAGFSLIEVLVVLIISGVVLVSLSSMIIMSQRSASVFSNANQEDAKFFFFEQQVQIFAQSISADRHPDKREDCSLEGNSNALNGCFFNIFSGTKTLERFAVDIDQTPEGSNLKIEYSGASSVWIRHGAPITISFIDQTGRETSKWPPEDRASLNGSRPDERESIPLALVINFNPEPRSQSGRKLIASINP